MSPRNPRPFKVPAFRAHTNGTYTVRSYGQRFSVRPDGDQWIVFHLVSYWSQPFDCLAVYDTLDEAKAGVIEIAKMAYDDPEAFPPTPGDIERRGELAESNFRAMNDLAYIAPNIITNPDKNARPTAGGLLFFIENMAPKLMTVDLPDSERYRLKQASIMLARIAGRVATSAEGNVVKFPGAAE